MMNQYSNYDMDNCVFVIDSMTTAFMTAVITGTRPAHIILERKKKWEQDATYNMIKNFITTCISAKQLDEIELTAPYFIKSYQFNKIMKLKKETYKLYDRYNEKKVFIGPSTSTVMMCLPPQKYQILYLYHGVGDYIKREELASRNIIRKIKDQIIASLFHIPNSRWSGFWPSKCFSLCHLKEKGIIWVDYKKFHSELIEEILTEAIHFDNTKKNVFFCPLIPGMTEQGMMENTSLYDEINLEFIRRYIDPVKERVFFKFHPYLYRANSNVIIDLKDKLNEKGIEAYDIGMLIPEKIGGSLLPIEVILRYIPFQKLIAQDTSAIWNLSEDHTITKIEDVSDTVGKTRACYDRILSILKKKCNLSTINIVERKQ